MTVSVQDPITITTANGVTTVFPFSFKVVDEDDLSVELGGVAATGYTVADVGENTGSITFSVAPASGVEVKMYRDMAATRSADYQNSGDFLSGTVNTDFDRLWLYAQQLFKFFSRTFRVPVGETLSSLPDAATRANKVLGFDENGDTSITELTEAVQNAADTFVEDVQDIADEAEASATNAATSETNAATSATNAATSETNSAASETNAAASEVAAAVSEGNSQQFALQAAANGQIYDDTTKAQSNGVVAFAIAAGGSAGTDGTYTNVTTTGGAGTGAYFSVVVAGGAITAVTQLAPGDSYTSNPTLDLSGITGLTGASVTCTIGQNRPSGTYYLIPLSGGDGAAQYYLNNSGTPYTENEWVLPNLPSVLPLSKIAQAAYSAAYRFYDEADLDGRYELVYDTNGDLRIYSEISATRGSITYTTLPESAEISSRTTYFFEDYPDLVQAILDTNSELRILEARGATYTGPLVFGASSNNTRRYSFDDYPDYVKVALDSDGVWRILEARGPNYTGPVVFGADSGGSGTVTIPFVFYLFLVAGQSNAKGTGVGADSPSVPAGIGYWWDNVNGILTHLEDPSPVSSSTAGSAWPSFANRFNELTGAGVIVVNAAVGSSAQTVEAAPAMSDQHWDDTGALRDDALDQLNAAIAYLDAQGIAYQFGGVLWSQGERESNAIDDADIPNASNYKVVFADMVDYFRTETGRPNMRMVLSQTGYDSGGATTGFTQIQTAQAELVNELDHVYMGYSGAKTAVARGLMKDELHYLQQIYNEMGPSMAATAASVCLGQI